jgi:hypothetical protein
MAPPATWSVQALGRARWRLLWGRGRVRLPRSRLSPSPGVGRGGVRRLPKSRLSPSPGVGRGGVRRPRSRLSPSPGVGRGEVHLPRPRRGLSPGVGRGEVHLPRPRRGPSPGVGRGGASYGARGRTWLLSASLCRVAQQSEWRKQHCFLVRSVSGAAKWLRSLRLCRLKSARQDKVSGHPCIKCSCDMVGWRGDLAKVASLRRLGLRRAEGASVAWGGPRARRESSGVSCLCPRLGSGEARSCPLSGLSLDLNRTHQAFAALCWWVLPAEIRSLGGTPNYGPRQYFTNEWIKLRWFNKYISNPHMAHIQKKQPFLYNLT